MTAGTIKSRLQEKGWAKNYSAMIPPEMIYSRAFWALTPSGLRILIRFMQKRPFSKHGKGKAAKVTYETKGIPFSYSEAKIFGVSTSSFNRAINELVEKGFIWINYGGSGLQKDYSTYDLIDKYLEWDGKPIATKPKGASFGRPFPKKTQIPQTQPSVLTVDSCQ